MAGRKSDFTLTKLDDLFSTQEQRDEEKLSKIRDIPLTEIDDFPDHPFKVRDDEDMAQLIESIKKMRTRDPELSANWGTICTPVQMPAADGKIRKIQAANTEGLLRIIQSIPSPRQNLLSVGWPKLAVNASKKRLAQNRQSTVL